MDRQFTRDFLLEVAKGNIPKHSLLQKFGSNEALSTSWEVLSSNGLYETPASAQSLEFVSSSSADAVNGAGMREITVVGLDANWDEQTVAVAAHATDGTVAVAITGTWMRVYRAYVSSSGTYATSAAGSHVGTIDIQIASAGTIWAQIALIDGFPAGQTEIGAYTVPAGITAYVLNKNFSVEASKPMDINLFKRENADDVSSPYSGIMRLVEHTHGLEIPSGYNPKAIIGVFPEKTDIGFMAKMATGTGSGGVDFEILLVEN